MNSSKGIAGSTNFVSPCYAKYVGRVGALAVALGVGVALASSAPVAHAEGDTSAEGGTGGEVGAPGAPALKGSRSLLPTRADSTRGLLDIPRGLGPQEPRFVKDSLGVVVRGMDAARKAQEQTQERFERKLAAGTGERKFRRLKEKVETAPEVLGAIESKEMTGTFEKLVPIRAEADTVLQLGARAITSWRGRSPNLPARPERASLEGLTSGGPAAAVIKSLPLAQLRQRPTEFVSAFTGSTAIQGSKSAAFSTLDTDEEARVTIALAGDPPAPAPVPRVRSLVLGVLGAFGFDPTPGTVNNPILELLWGAYRRVESAVGNEAPTVGTPTVAAELDQNGYVVGDLGFTDYDGDSLTYTVDNDAVTIYDDGTFVYKPPQDWDGTTALTDTFTVTASDDNGFHLHGLRGIFGGGHTTSATYTVTIAATQPSIQDPVPVPVKEGTKPHGAPQYDPATGNTYVLSVPTPTEENPSPSTFYVNVVNSQNEVEAVELQGQPDQLLVSNGAVYVAWHSTDETGATTYSVTTIGSNGQPTVVAMPGPPAGSSHLYLGKDGTVYYVSDVPAPEPEEQFAGRMTTFSVWNPTGTTVVTVLRPNGSPTVIELPGGSAQDLVVDLDSGRAYQTTYGYESRTDESGNTYDVLVTHVSAIAADGTYDTQTYDGTPVLDRGLVLAPDGKAYQTIASYDENGQPQTWVVTITNGVQTSSGPLAGMASDGVKVGTDGAVYLYTTTYDPAAGQQTHLHRADDGTFATLASAPGYSPYSGLAPFSQNGSVYLLTNDGYTTYLTVTGDQTYEMPGEASVMSVNSAGTVLVYARESVYDEVTDTYAETHYLHVIQNGAVTTTELDVPDGTQGIPSFSRQGADGAAYLTLTKFLDLENPDAEPKTLLVVAYPDGTFRQEEFDGWTNTAAVVAANGTAYQPIVMIDDLSDVSTVHTRIYVIKQGQDPTYITVNGATAQFDPIVSDDAGRLYVTSSIYAGDLQQPDPSQFSVQITVLDPDGTHTVISGLPGGAFTGVTIAPDGTVYQTTIGFTPEGSLDGTYVTVIRPDGSSHTGAEMGGVPIGLTTADFTRLGVYFLNGKAYMTTTSGTWVVGSYPLVEV